ncbi:MAG: type II secretion system F family protein [Gammaproteobacteria bacterium]
MWTDYTILLIMVFVAVALLSMAMFVPTFGTDAHIARRLRRRVREVEDALDPAAVSLLREKYWRELPPLGKAMQGLPGMEGLARLVEQAGLKTRAYRVVLQAAGLALGAGVIVAALTKEPLFGLPAAVAAFFLPILNIRLKRNRRIALFEEQLPDALAVMSRALRAGLPFTEAMRFVAEDSAEPIAGEFRTAYSDINYGMSTKAAFLALLERVPSMSFMTVVTAVVIQRETGGNMAEILDKIAAVVRGRFRLQRRVRTLSAEGRMSAWILVLLPFVLVGALFVTEPGYLPGLTKDPLGRWLILGACVNMTVGILWMRKIIRIEV